MLFYPAALPLSTSTLNRFARLIRTHRKTIGSTWRALDPGTQARLTLAYLHKGETLRDLAAGFGISAATASRRTRETITLLADGAPGIRDALGKYSLFALGDKGYDGLDRDLVVTPFKGKGKPEWQKEYNRLHARLRGPGERMFAQLKTWSIFDQVRCDPNWVTQIAKAIQVLNDYEHRSS